MTLRAGALKGPGGVRIKVEWFFTGSKWFGLHRMSTCWPLCSVPMHLPLQYWKVSECAAFYVFAHSGNIANKTVLQERLPREDFRGRDRAASTLVHMRLVWHTLAPWLLPLESAEGIECRSARESVRSAHRDEPELRAKAENCFDLGCLCGQRAGMRRAPEQSALLPSQRQYHDYWWAPPWFLLHKSRAKIISLETFENSNSWASGPEILSKLFWVSVFKSPGGDVTEEQRGEPPAWGPRAQAAVPNENTFSRAKS